MAVAFAAGPVADAAGVTAEFWDAGGLEVCGCFGDGAGGFNALRTASGVAGSCCASNGVASDANQKTISQLARFAFRMILY
jgi:hypothetical protein